MGGWLLCQESLGLLAKSSARNILVDYHQRAASWSFD